LKSLTTTDSLLVLPGEVLLEEFLRPMGISQYRLAQATDVPESRINAIVKGRRGSPPIPTSAYAASSA
jgi:addiction module HigA family antidote